MPRLPHAFRSWPRAARWTVVIAALVGLATRIGWALTRADGSANGEAYNIAVAIAQGRGFADVFAVGQGPTAHLLPLPPLIAGGVYALLGVRSVAAETVLLGWALALTFGIFVLFWAIARRLGVPFGARVAAFAFLCAAPIFTTVETFDFRAWEGGMTMAAAGAFLLLLLRAEEGEPTGWPQALALAGLPALVLFLQPVMGLAACAAAAVALWRGRVRMPRAALVAFPVVVAVLFGTWTARNLSAMHEPIWLRDNLGLELAVANYPAAVAAQDPRATFHARLAQVHPMVGAGAYRALQAAGGEPAYARLRGAEAIAWMRANPGDVARLWSGHLRQMVVPPPWLFQTARGRVLPVVRSVLFGLASLAGWCGLVLLWRPQGSRALLIAPFVVLPVLAYVPFQPITRYIWLIYVPLVYLGAYAVSAVGARARA